MDKPGLENNLGKWVSHGGSCPGWGLGFVVYKGSDGSKWVSHGGSCPGYRSTFQLNPKSKDSSANDEDDKDLKEYVGYYSPMPWWSELYISSWEGKLVELGLPSESPAESMTFFKHIEGDTFRRIRDDGELGESLVFERNQKGEIIHYKQHGNYSKRIK